MATLTKILTDAANPMKDYKFFGSGGMYRVMRYEFDVTLVVGDATTDINLGVVSPLILLQSAFLSANKVAGTGVETTTIKLATGTAINGNLVHPLVTNPTAIPSAIGSNNVIGFPGHITATDFFTNGAADRFLESVRIDLGSEGLNLNLTSSADPTGTGAQIKGYIQLVGLDMSNNNNSI